MSKHIDAVTAWEQLGEQGRESLRAHLVWVSTGSNAPYRYLSDVMLESDVASMTCSAHPLERVAASYGCYAKTCCDGHASLNGQRAMRASLAFGNHAVSLVRAFLDSPHLAFPPDIPGYALRCAAWVKVEEVAMARRAKKRQRAAEKAAAAEVHKLEIAQRAAARKQQRKAQRTSYAYRIAQAEKKATKISIEVVKLEKRAARLQKQKARAWRSVNALKIAAQKKGQLP